MEISEYQELKKLGKRIREIRESKRLSQFDLATVCLIPKSQIGRIERAEINTTFLTLLKISKALDVSVKDLLDFEREVKRDKGV